MHMESGMLLFLDDAQLQVLLRCGELFQDLSDADMELKFTPWGKGRSEVWQDSCQAKVSNCFPKNGGSHGPRAAERCFKQSSLFS